MDSIAVRVQATRYEAADILSFEFAPLQPGELPAFTAGAHVDVYIAPGLVRSYSLCNAQDDRHRYRIAVHHGGKSRGGARQMHESLRAGQTVEISPPRNHFVLQENADASVLIAGGIGITPLLAMVRRLHALNRHWELFYCARSGAHAAFLDELRQLAAASSRGKLHLHFDDQAKGLLDIAAIIKAAKAGTHFYCCGPQPMLQAFELACQGLPAEQIHLEYFNAKEAAPLPGGFDVQLARSGVTVQVAAGQSILDTLLAAGVTIPYSCREGICGSCEVRVLEGEPDHRDLVLSPSEQAENKVMMVCCSGSKSARLVLDC